MSSDIARDADRALLLAALRPQPDDFVELLARREVHDWQWILERATAHKVDALLASRVGAAGTQANVPGEIREPLDAAGARALACHDRALRDLERLDRCFKRAGVSYLLVKGPVLTQQLYDNPAQRSFFDLDVVVPEGQIDAAQAALEGLGYHLWGGDRYLGFAPDSDDDLALAVRVMRASLKRFGHELALVTADRSLIPIDLHWQLMPRGRIVARAAEDLWQRATTTSVGGIDVRVLDAEATLLFLAMHAWSNRPWSFALLHLCDVAWALQRLPVDPDRLLKLADRWGGRGGLARALYAIEHVLGVKPPAELQTGHGELMPPERFRRIATAETLLDHHACPAPGGWARRRQELDWGLAMGSLRSTALLLLGKYTAVIRYRAARFAARRS